MKDKRRHNHIGPINSSRGNLNSVSEIKEEVVRHLSNKFGIVEEANPLLDGICFDMINEEDCRWLERSFEEVEIKEAIWGCDGSKIPGPDGGELSKVISSSFLALVPNSSNPLSLDEYRPICLVGCMYKVLTKNFAGRLKRVLNSIISYNQSAFVPERQLLDGVLVANEVVDYSRKEGAPCILFKVDSEKTYDSVSWNFLRYILVRMGFGERWRKWMEILIFKRNMSVLVNGSPTTEFVVKRGLRQEFLIALSLCFSDGGSNEVGSQID
ncbi:uncharacterized protein LOC131624376 [Vicia villosa]|uniref:uncharacterized protein LOC131624376 n=1 Tax=Vicia villosa TaxID=3911 RepID=UPI00273C42CD|nr:uncharacterized protein LOC131624376 [Vicia villosa]